MALVKLFCQLLVLKFVGTGIDGLYLAKPAETTTAASGKTIFFCCCCCCCPLTTSFFCHYRSFTPAGQTSASNPVRFYSVSGLARCKVFFCFFFRDGTLARTGHQGSPKDAKLYQQNVLFKMPDQQK